MMRYFRMLLYIHHLAGSTEMEISQLHCLRLRISNRNIFEIVTNTQDSQLQKFRRILSSLHNVCLKFLRQVTKIRNRKCWQNFIKFTFFLEVEKYS